MSFDALIADMTLLAKALPSGDADDAAIAAAAGDAGPSGDEQEEDVDSDAEGTADDGGADGEGGEKPMAKSFEFTLEDGTKVQALDGAEMVKALTERVESSEATVLKALTMSVDMIKSLTTEVTALRAAQAKLASEGRGRKTVVTVSEKTTQAEPVLAKSEPVGMKPEEFFAKAHAAQQAGRISARDVSVAETYLNRGMPVPAHIASRVMG